METQILEYGDWMVKSTANMYQVCSLNYDENTFIGVRKIDIEYILETSSISVEPQLVAILFAAILYARKTVTEHNFKYKRLTRNIVSNGLRNLFKVNNIYSYDILLNTIENSKPRDIEELLNSNNPMVYIQNLID